MNAPFRPAALRVSAANLRDPAELHRIEAYVSAHPEATPFHRPAWLLASAQGTGNRAHALLAERSGEIAAYLPLTEIHSPLFGRMLASSGFAVGGGLLVQDGVSGGSIFAAVEEMALRLSCPAIELRGGALPLRRAGWSIKRDSHCGFIQPLAADNEAQLTQIPRKQRAEVRKGLAGELTVTTGSAAADRVAPDARIKTIRRGSSTPGAGRDRAA